MKLSEMNTKQLAKALCELTHPVANLCGDRKVLNAFAVFRDIKNGKHVGTLADVIEKVAPVLLDDHYNDVATILSALTGKSLDEINAQSGMQTITDMMQCMDGDLISFFMPSRQAGKEPS